VTGWLEGYCALITGGGSGIGAAVAHRYVDEGAAVAIMGRGKDRLDDVLARSSNPRRMLAIEGDVRSVEDLANAVDQTVRSFGRLDVLVPNAGMWDFQRQLTKLTGHELAPKVRVNGVACGGMNTDLRGPASLDLAGRSIATSFAKNNDSSPRPPIPLWDSSTDPNDFTGCYVLLASREQAGPITGQAISVDGGMGVRGFRSDAGGDNL
jgi:NAD(P)-dependent dehydrogenase (short-subunit alcohol dehydrogenase family)